MSREADICGLGSTVMIIAPGATNALLVIPPAGEVSSLIKYGAGGSMELVQSQAGVTLTGSSLVPLIGTGYLMGTTETVNIDGPARYYIVATGATVTAYHLTGFSSGMTFG